MSPSAVQRPGREHPKDAIILPCWWQCIGDAMEFLVLSRTTLLVVGAVGAVRR